MIDVYHIIQGYFAVTGKSYQTIRFPQYQRNNPKEYGYAIRIISLKTTTCPQQTKAQQNNLYVLWNLLDLFQAQLWLVVDIVQSHVCQLNNHKGYWWDGLVTNHDDKTRSVCIMFGWIYTITMNQSVPLNAKTVWRFIMFGLIECLSVINELADTLWINR